MHKIFYCTKYQILLHHSKPVFASNLSDSIKQSKIPRGYKTVEDDETRV